MDALAKLTRPSLKKLTMVMPSVATSAMLRAAPIPTR